MENAQLISLSRQIALQRQMDVVANNLANINTTGFKGESLLFEDYIMPVAADDDFMPADRDLHYTMDWSTVHDMAGGSIEQTGNPLDVALSGNGFLVVQTPQGERYTRAGSLQIGADGTLVDLNGNPVLSDGGPIQFQPSETDITIAADGAISTSEGPKGALRVVEFADPRHLAKAGDNLYAGDGAVDATGTAIVQGSIERSNVSGVTQLTEMIRIQRAYQSLATLMQKQDDIRSTAINRLGDLNA
jgi:flagellar basal-body rod protein FlgF